MAGVTIKVRENGPYQVIGAVEVVDHEGNVIPLPEDGKVFLCRCGRSKNRPYCDGTHKTGSWCKTFVNEVPEAGRPL
jgi:CDGSH iron-sulfur domain-containing protein 3